MLYKRSTLYYKRSWSPAFSCTEEAWLRIITCILREGSGLSLLDFRSLVMACALVENRERNSLPKLVIKEHLTKMYFQASCGDLRAMRKMIDSAVAQSEALLLPSGPHREEEEGRAPPIALSSPVLGATWAGHTSIVSYLVKNYSDVVAEQEDVSTITIPRARCCEVRADSHKHRHSPSIASHVAASLGLVKILHLLRSVGACHEWRDELGRTPLHWAAYFRHVNAVKYMLGVGASANATSTHGVTPLMDCLEGVKCESQIETLTLLIENGADIRWIACDGASVLDMLLSLSADEKYKLISNLVQSKTETKMMIESVLIHVVFDGGIDAVTQYVSSARGRPNKLVAQCSKYCPAAFADCLLCLSFHCTSVEQVKPLWEHAFRVRRENEVIFSGFSPIQVYGNRQEVTSWEEAEQILSQAAQTSDLTEILYQSFMVIERVMGRDNPYVIEMLLGISFHSCKVSENFFLRGLELLNACLQSLKRPFHMTLTNLQHTDEIDYLVENGYTPNFAQLLQRLLNTLTLAHKASVHFHSCNVQEFYICLTRTAFSMLCRMAYLHHKHHGTSSETLPSEIEEFGQQLLSLSSVIALYFAIMTDTPQWVNSEERAYISFITECFQSWALSSGALYALDSEGHRPIEHISSNFPQPLLELLLEHGAHVDAVNSNNLSPQGWQAMLEPQGARKLAHVQELVTPPPSVLPLACLAARAAIDGNIPYQSLDYVPRHLKQFLSIHDCKASKGLFKHKRFVIISKSSIALTIFP